MMAPRNIAGLAGSTSEPFQFRQPLFPLKIEEVAMSFARFALSGSSQRRDGAGRGTGGSRAIPSSVLNLFFRYDQEQFARINI